MRVLSDPTGGAAARRRKKPTKLGVRSLVALIMLAALSAAAANRAFLSCDQRVEVRLQRAPKGSSAGPEVALLCSGRYVLTGRPVATLRNAAGRARVELATLRAVGATRLTVLRVVAAAQLEVMRAKAIARLEDWHANNQTQAEIKAEAEAPVGPSRRHR